MVTVFANEKGLILIEFKPPNETITADTYCQVLRNLKEHVRHKRPELWRMTEEGYRHLFLHHDNAPSHTAIPTLALIGESNLDMLSHPPYSPDLAPCDYFIFPRLKNDLRGHRFHSINDLKIAVTRTLRAIPAEDYMTAIRSMPICWMKCISAKGEYFKGSHIQVDPEDFGLEMIWEGDEEEEED